MQSTSNRFTTQQLGQYAVYFLCFATVIRLIRDMYVKWGASIEPGTDLSIYFDAAQALLRRVNPFDPTELLLGQEVTPIIFPPQMILIIPFYQLGEPLGTIAFFFLCAMLTFLWFKVVFQRLDLWHLPTSFKLSPQSQFTLLSLCLFFNSPQLKHAFYTGQLSQVAFPCLFFAMFAKGVFLRSLFLAIAAAAKYSIVPFIGLAFLIIRDFRTCVLATVLFLGIAALPALFGHNLFTLYGEYFAKLGTVVGNCSFDTYCGGFSTDHLLHFSFFKIDIINSAVRALLLFGFTIAFFSEYRNKNLGLNFILLANAITLIVAYHRFYDMPGLQLFLIVFMNICFLRHLWTEGAIFTGFILFSLIPVPWMQTISYHLGAYSGENSWIYTISRSWYPINFPLYAVYIFVVTVFSLSLYFFRNSKISFLPPR